ncbi:hypothetical protein F7725_016274 [Dissostichus mawsoni]|uniref:MKRN2 opposite strand protein-like C-terminal domain-containing protein n=1 Tax=Dissostichus mawsoni TaxID=36200 RepID=A0A7J5Z352_DISMA|nr:hypothetical protein F7725_016274 [Dissostichus mawsoni]
MSSDRLSPSNQVPGACPSCGEDLRERRLQEAPVSLPSPFSNAHKTSCCLLVAPAHNNTTSEFDGTSDLHTGISNTEGVVYNYTRAGVVRELSGWERCVSVPLGREALSRETFTQIFILPRVQRVQKYLFLYKQPAEQPVLPGGQRGGQTGGHTGGKHRRGYRRRYRRR